MIYRFHTFTVYFYSSWSGTTYIYTFLCGFTVIVSAFNPLSPHDASSFYIPEKRLNFLTTRGVRKKNSMKLFYQYMYMTILANLSTSSRHLHPLQVENCDSDARLVVDEDANDKFRPERVKPNIETEKVILAKYIKIRILYLQLLLSRAPSGDCTTLIVDIKTLKFQ